MNAKKLYEQFRGSVAKKILRIGIRFGGRWLTDPAPTVLDIPTQLAVIGRVNAIEYDAIYDRKLTKARHAFAPGSRPLLAVGSARGQVFLIGDGYRFTDRGFVDFRGGTAIDYDEKTGKAKTLRLDRGE